MYFFIKNFPFFPFTFKFIISHIPRSKTLQLATLSRRIGLDFSNERAIPSRHENDRIVQKTNN